MRQKNREMGFASKGLKRRAARADAQDNGGSVRCQSGLKLVIKLSCFPTRVKVEEAR